MATMTEVSHAPARETRISFPVLLVMFCVSGACGLVYQQLWLRELTLVFGVTVHAVATVLAAFFAGLALGSYLAGRFAEAVRRPLRAYGIIEILVGVLALLTPAALDVTEHLYVAIAHSVSDSRSVLTLLRFVLSFVVLVVPATLLGASLPLIVKSSLPRSRQLGERVSLLYATNTAGAIVGTLVAGFLLIGRYGVLTSFRIAALANIAVGVAAFVLSRTFDDGQEPASDDAAPGGGTVPFRDVTDRVRTTVLVAFTISGLAAIALEVVWFRMLVLYLDSNTYAFTIMLATVLGGIALGSYLAAPLLRWFDRSLVLLAVTELAVAFAALLSVSLLSKSYGVADALSGLVGSTEPDGLRFVLVASALAILPTTLLMGLAFPIGLSVWIGGVEPGRRVGTFYACNVAGGIVGSIVAGFVLVPRLGTRTSVVFLAALLLLSGLLIIAVAGQRAAQFRLGVGAVALFIVLALVVVPDPYRAALNHRYAGQEVLWLDEDAQTTVSINERADGRRLMYLDGLSQASDDPYVVAYHRLIGTLPMAVHPDPKQALVIGLGGGVTAGAVSGYPGVQLEVIELSPGVVEGARFFSRVNNGVVDRDNVEIRIDDGRNHLLVTEQRYDVITSDIILPEHAGAGKLWSVEFWELARDALTDDGVMLQWATGHRTQAEYDMVVRSFTQVFPSATLWAGGSLLVGTKAPFELERSKYEEKLAIPGVQEYLAAAKLGSFDELTKQYWGGPEEIRASIGSGPTLTDDHPRIEYFRSLDTDNKRVNPIKVRGDVSDITDD